MFQRKNLGKTILQSANLPATDIEVATVQLEDALLVYEITATVGTHVEIQRHGIGLGGTQPIQPAGSAMTSADLQTALDGHRQSVANTVAWRAAMDMAAGQVK